MLSGSDILALLTGRAPLPSCPTGGSSTPAPAAAAAQPGGEAQPATKRQRVQPPDGPVQPAGLQSVPAAVQAAAAPKQPKWSIFLDDEEEPGGAPQAAQQRQGWQAHADVQQPQPQQGRPAAEPVQPGGGSHGRAAWGQAAEDAGVDDLQLSPSSLAGMTGGYRPIVRPPQAAALAAQPPGWGQQPGTAPQRAGHVQHPMAAAAQQPSRAPQQPPLQQPAARPVQVWQQAQQAQAQAQTQAHQQQQQRMPLQPSRQQQQQQRVQPKPPGHPGGGSGWKPPSHAATALHSGNSSGPARPAAVAGPPGGSGSSGWNRMVDGVVQLGWPSAEEAARPARRVAVPDGFTGGGPHYVQTWCNALLEELNLRWVFCGALPWAFVACQVAPGSLSWILGSTGTQAHDYMAFKGLTGQLFSPIALHLHTLLQHRGDCAGIPQCCGAGRAASAAAAASWGPPRRRWWIRQAKQLGLAGLRFCRHLLQCLGEALPAWFVSAFFLEEHIILPSRMHVPLLLPHRRSGGAAAAGTCGLLFKLRAVHLEEPAGQGRRAVRKACVAFSACACMSGAVRQGRSPTLRLCAVTCVLKSAPSAPWAPAGHLGRQAWRQAWAGGGQRRRGGGGRSQAGECVLDPKGRAHKVCRVQVGLVEH